MYNISTLNDIISLAESYQTQRNLTFEIWERIYNIYNRYKGSKEMSSEMAIRYLTILVSCKVNFPEEVTDWFVFEQSELDKELKKIKENKKQQK